MHESGFFGWSGSSYLENWQKSGGERECDCEEEEEEAEVLTGYDDLLGLE